MTIRRISFFAIAAVLLASAILLSPTMTSDLIGSMQTECEGWSCKDQGWLVRREKVAIGTEDRSLLGTEFYNWGAKLIVANNKAEFPRSPTDELLIYEETDTSTPFANIAFEVKGAYHDGREITSKASIGMGPDGLYINTGQGANIHIEPDGTIELRGVVAIGEGILFPDGSYLDTAPKDGKDGPKGDRGPQGPQGRQGPQGEKGDPGGTVDTFAICGPYASCQNSTERSWANSPCVATSDTGSCSLQGQLTGMCKVCSPR